MPRSPASSKASSGASPSAATSRGAHLLRDRAPPLVVRDREASSLGRLRQADAHREDGGEERIAGDLLRPISPI